MRKYREQKIGLVLLAYLFIFSFSCFSQKDTFQIKLRQEKINANLLRLKNHEVIQLTEKAFEITAKSSANKLVSSYSIKLYDRNDKKLIIVHLNSDVTDLTGSTFIGGYLNPQGKPVYCFGIETLVLFDEVDETCAISFLSGKYETDELFTLNGIDTKSILEGKTTIDGEEFQIIVEFIPEK